MFPEYVPPPEENEYLKEREMKANMNGQPLTAQQRFLKNSVSIPGLGGSTENCVFEVSLSS